MKLLLFVISLLLANEGVGQFLTPRQKRLEDRINRLLNLRYDTDSLLYEMGYDKESRRLLLYNPRPLQDTLDSLRRINAFRQEEIKSIDKQLFSVQKNSVSLALQMKDTMEANNRLKSLLEGLSKRYSQDSTTLQLRTQELTLLKQRYHNDSLRLAGKIPTPKSTYVPDHQPVDSTEDKDPPLGLSDTHTVLTNENESLKSRLQRQQKSLDIVRGESLQIKNANKRLQQQIKGMYLPITILLGTATLFLLLFVLGRLRHRPSFYPCLVLKEQEDIVFADVFFEEEERTELRKFEKAPLQKLLAAQPPGPKMFQLGIVSTVGRKEFLYRKAKKSHKKLFDAYYEKFKHEL